MNKAPLKPVLNYSKLSWTFLITSNLSSGDYDMDSVFMYHNGLVFVSDRISALGKKEIVKKN